MKTKKFAAASDVLAAAQSIDTGSSRSCLEPYRQAILVLRKKGKSFAGIAEFLVEQGGPRVSPQMIHKFVRKSGKLVEVAEILPAQPEQKIQTRQPAEKSEVPAVSQTGGAVPKLNILDESAAEAYRKKIRDHGVGSGD